MFKYLLVFAVVFLFCVVLRAQDVEASKAKSWSLDGRIQLQHLYDNSIKADDMENNNGFRMRRTRLEVKAKLTDWVSGKIQFEVRDNAPRLKDAEAKMKIFERYNVRLGQFKVPVWREELRSSGSLFLVERSETAAFLEENLLSSRHIGLEVGGSYKNGISFAVNYSNGAGEGVREDAGISKYHTLTSLISDTLINVPVTSPNNGKLFTGRINYAIKKIAEIGISVALNQLGNKISDLNLDNKGNVYVIAPDFGLYLPFGLEIEGGLAVGEISGDLTSGSSSGNIIINSKDKNFNLADVTALWKKSLDKPMEKFGGFDGYGFAAGISYIEPDTHTDDNELLSFRFGPVIFFGKQFRIQVNGEIEHLSAPDTDDIFKIRSQATLNL